MIEIWCVRWVDRRGNPTRSRHERGCSMTLRVRNRSLMSTLGASLAAMPRSGRCQPPSALCRLLHSAMNDVSEHGSCDSDSFPREWALLDTRNQAFEEFIVRNWVGHDGRSTPLADPVVRRGGLLALLTSCPSCVSVGRVAGGVDHGVGLLLCGMASALTMPLPPHAAITLDANWLCVLSRSPSDFSSETQIQRLMLMTWVILQDPLAPDEPYRHCPGAETRSHSRSLWPSEPAAIPTAG